VIGVGFSFRKVLGDDGGDGGDSDCDVDNDDSDNCSIFVFHMERGSLQ